MKKRRISSGILAGVAICLLLNPDLGAQTSRVNGNLLGTVIDSSGAVIPGATVQVRNLSTGLSRTQESDANGQFKIRELPSGTYHVTVIHDGSAPLLRQGTSSITVALAWPPASHMVCSP